MNFYLLTASILVFLLGIIHSIAGEILLLQHLFDNKELPVLQKNPDMARWTISMVWHIATVFALVIGIILFQFSFLPQLDEFQIVITITISASMFFCFFISLLMTKARHFSWVAFLVIGIFCWLGIL